RMLAAVEESAGEQTGHIFRLDRAVADTPARSFDLDQRLQPIGAARARAHDFDIELRALGRIRKRYCDMIGADGNRARITRNEQAPLHLRASSRSALALALSSRACGVSSSSAAGAQAQSPRQYTCSSVTLSSGVVSPKLMPSSRVTCSARASPPIDWQASAPHSFST